MNTSNAIAFFILGTVMQVVSHSASLGGGLQLASSESLWLQVMGLVTGFIGGSYLVRSGAREVSTAWSRLALRRSEAREQLARGTASRGVSLSGVRVTF